ncbi:MAG: 3-hydroxyacyl-CoA dehydrogenase NAD-binding domain-containing protein, partial [Chloroflexota bacterium]
MDTFAFIIHPIDPKRDVSRKFPFLGRVLSENQIDFFSTFFPPVYISEIHGIQSNLTGKQVKGWFIACPFTPKRMMSLPKKTVYNKIIQAGKLAEKLGAKILGLGAYTSVVGDAGITISKYLNIPVTTGDSYTVAIAVEAIEKAAIKMDISLENAKVAVVGATGAIGKVCAELLAEKAAEVTLIGKRLEALDTIKATLNAKECRAEIKTSTDISDIKNAKLILTVTSDIESIIEPAYLQAGSVICDVARPRDVSGKVAAERDDILVIDGGVVDIPGDVDFNFNFGFPPGQAYACMAETIALALEGRFE